MNYSISGSLILLGIIFSANKANTRYIQRIVGGKIAIPHLFGYQVSLQNHYNRNFCGAGIIHARYVVTAGHCVVKKESDRIRTKFLSIVAGTNLLEDPNSPEIRIQVSAIYIPSDYKWLDTITGKRIWAESNIAVLELAEDLDVVNDPRLQVLEIPTKRFVQNEKSLKISGFGVNAILYRENGDIKKDLLFDNILRQADVVLMNNTDCQSMFYTPIYESNICGRVHQKPTDRPKGACIGDIGSPLVSDGSLLVGILLRATRMCNERIKPSIYTDVFALRGFLQNILTGTTDDMRIATWTKKNNSSSTYKFVEVVEMDDNFISD